MLLIAGTFRLPHKNLAAALPVMQRMVESSRAEDGCIEYIYAEDVFEPGLIYVRELWAEQDALTRHLHSRHLAEWRAAWPELGIGDRHLRVYEVDAGQPT